MTTTEAITRQILSTFDGFSVATATEFIFEFGVALEEEKETRRDTLVEQRLSLPTYLGI